jgi:hypothetical protein
MPILANGRGLPYKAGNGLSIADEWRAVLREYPVLASALSLAQTGD